MLSTVTMRFEKPIASVNLTDEATEDSGMPCAEADELLKAQKESLAQVCQVLQDVVDKINNFQRDIFEKNTEQIAKLSVEIARKILVQKIQEGDYEIESIVKEALKNAPKHQDVVVHLNPEDHAQCQKALQDDAADTLTGIKFVADSNVGRAECRLESPKGIIESLIDENLERIGKALEEAG